MTSFRAVPSNNAPIRHLTELPGHTKAKGLPVTRDIPQSDSIEQTDDISPDDSASNVSKALTLLSSPLREFQENVHIQRAEFEKKLKGQNPHKDEIRH